MPHRSEAAITASLEKASTVFSLLKPLISSIFPPSSCGPGHAQLLDVLPLRAQDTAQALDLLVPDLYLVVAF